jgi:hypothetical protein
VTELNQEKIETFLDKFELYPASQQLITKFARSFEIDLIGIVDDAWLNPFVHSHLDLPLQTQKIFWFNVAQLSLTLLQLSKVFQQCTRVKSLKVHAQVEDKYGGIIEGPYLDPAGLAQILKPSLIKNVTSLELDIVGRETMGGGITNWARIGMSRGHFCPSIAKIIPQLKVLKLRIASICKDMVPISDKQSSAIAKNEQRVDIPEFKLETLFINMAHFIIYDEDSDYSALDTTRCCHVDYRLDDYEIAAYFANRRFIEKLNDLIVRSPGIQTAKITGFMGIGGDVWVRDLLLDEDVGIRNLFHQPSLADQGLESSIQAKELSGHKIFFPDFEPKAAAGSTEVDNGEWVVVLPRDPAVRKDGRTTGEYLVKEEWLTKELVEWSSLEAGVGENVEA